MLNVHRVLGLLVLAAALALGWAAETNRAPADSRQSNGPAISGESSPMLCRGGAYHSRNRTQKFFQRAAG
jgi:hypothetical protein